MCRWNPAGQRQSNEAGSSLCVGWLSLEELVTELELPEPLLRKRLGFWVSKGVLKEVSANLYELQESAPTVESLQSGHLDEEHSPQPNLPTREACSNELRQCESFVQGMLKNYSSLPLERIHNFLQRFMVEPAYTQSESQLKDFLAQKVQDGKLEFDGSSYSLAQAQ
ncbi:unnamed protein product [Effrenium voratum]|nr:unnamed protein product [Effrenium voratum]